MNQISLVILSYLCYVKAQSTYGSGVPEVKGDDTCYNPGGGEGRCISLYDCPAVHNVVTKSPKSPEEVAILKQTQCGVDGRTPKVCCPDHYAPADKADACLTPEWRQGKCVELQSCPRISRLFKPPVSMEIFIFAKKSTCKGPGKDMQGVCCGVEKEGRSVNGCKPSTSIPSFESGCCGTESMNGDRIVGGSATSIDQYPWLAVIEYLRDGQVSLRCGGVLISGRYVLTAGHCVLGKVLAAGKPWRVRLAEYDISNDVAEKDCKAANGGGQDCTKGATAIGVDKIIPHPEYIAEHHLKRHDIALLKLKSMAPYTDFIRPICLPTVDHTLKPPENLNFSVAGWGATDDNHFKSNIKQHVEVPFMSLDKCQEKISVPLREGQVCAGGEEGKDSCKGDSGGPLSFNNGKAHELVGIVSFGSQQCGQKGVPGVYTRVYEYMPWIKSVIES